MKNTIPFFLFFIFSLALGCEVLEYFSKNSNESSRSCVIDIDVKEEAEKSDESDEKTDTFYYLSSHISELALPASLLLKNAQFSIYFTTSDYSTIIYSPPECTL